MTLPINIPPIVTEPLQVSRNLIIPTLVREVDQLQRAFFLQNLNVVAQDSGVGYNSPLGTIVLSDILFHSQTYTNESGITVTFPDILLQAVLLSVNQTKNIVKTQIQGRAGTIKEYIGMGDYSLSIRLIICGDNGVYPEQAVQDIVTMCNCNKEITVTSKYLNKFGIQYMVIESYDINQDEGQYSRQAISISASSDKPVNLRFK